MENETVLALLLLALVIGLFVGSKMTEESMLTAIKKGELYSVSYDGCQDLFSSQSIQSGEVPSWQIGFNLRNESS